VTEISERSLGITPLAGLEERPEPLSADEVGFLASYNPQLSVIRGEYDCSSCNDEGCRACFGGPVKI